ncbi:M20/M25/M40 family metallo-hydrolase [Halorussus limi]|uniref:M20/M25/M40 family metallo-hydrolase n=1 Tax=Halorussus limi TaxID=2938695 RepID=A0A8U0HY49_9EURY|nr:M20/M25/M40 family metallo-hydrolase [Halorussus limi]UPV76082.1 M20/M25/M40 family metallo-hydrolase [Halorussus limi]
MNDFAREWDTDLREFAEELLRFDTTDGHEAPAQAFVRERLDALGFETYEWTADAEQLAGHDSFPDDPDEIPVEGRPSVGGVLEFGDPEAGRTLVLNGHVDVVPVARDSWSSDPFDPTWRQGGGASGSDEGDVGDGTETDARTLTARGAADMKCGLATCVFAAKHLHERATGDSATASLDGRVVVESVVGEEEGGIGAAAAALSNPYPFERDAAIIAEPTDLRPVTASEGSLMKRLRLEGRSAHAATRWRGVDVLPYFEEIRRAFRDLETERGESVTHPLYDRFPVPWPVVVGRVEAGDWASSVPAELTAELRIGVAPGETVAEVEDVFDRRLAELVADDEWLAEHPPRFERFSVQFEPSEIDADEPVVGAVQRAMEGRGLDDTDPRGATYGADARWYIEAGVPTVMFGPGNIEQAHFPDETIRWADVLTAGGVLADAAESFLD